MLLPFVWFTFVVLVSGYIVLSKGNENANGDLETMRMPINSGLIEVLNQGNIAAAVASRIQKVLGDVENAYLRGSGWNYMYTERIKLECEFSVMCSLVQ